MLRKSLLVALVACLTIAVAVPCLAKKQIADWSETVTPPDSRSPIILFYDDMESGPGGWSTIDNTALATTKFHLDTYYAFQGTYSWWCGEFDAGFAGGDGYANSWDQRLDVPPTDVSGAYYPILTFAYRYDSEAGYDFTWVQAESLGGYRNMNPGYNGSSGGWHDYGVYGFVMSAYDNPVKARFRFVSDGAWSDEDGLYDSDGGAFHCDNVKIFDFYGGAVYFYDDCEGGGLCTPSLPASAGNYWHIVSDYCSSYSVPHSWWCGDDADSSLIPGGLNNSLMTPQIDITGSLVCTLMNLIHAEVPTVDNDYWTEDVSTDGGTTWYQIGAWWGDFGECGRWGSAGIAGYDLEPYLPGTGLYFMITFHTTDNGCGPGAAGGAGINLDDTWVEDWTGSPVETKTWGRIKAMYK